MKTGPYRDVCTLYVHFGIIHNRQDIEKPKCPTVDEWIKKICVRVYNTMELLFSQKKEGHSVIYDNMDLEGSIVSEINQKKTHTV